MTMTNNQLENLAVSGSVRPNSFIRGLLGTEIEIEPSAATK
jgi:hypothetical protein